MAPDSIFSRSNQESGAPDDPSEAVRIIDAGEAAEAVERGEAVKRKPSDEPRYGDRPEPPSAGVTPALRFPLSDTTDPASIERPRVAPVEPRVAEGSVEPILSVEPATGETELPHWTDPATGEVPRVIIGDGGDDDDEQERWSTFAASSSGPRWRDEHEDWHEHDVAATFGEAESPIGALDVTERQSQESFLTFDDLDVPESDVGRADPSGTSADPIRITSSQPRSSVPPTPPARRSRTPQAEPTDDTGDGAGSGQRSGGRDVPQAVFVGLAIAVVALILFKIGPGATMIIVEAVVVLAGIELFSALRQGGYRPATLLGLAAVVAYPLAVYWRGDSAMPVVLFLTFAFSVLWFMLGIGGSAKVVPNLGVTVLGAVYVGLLGSFAALILDIPAEGVSLLLVTVVGAVFYDIGGFFIGQRLGRTPLTVISPNKTVEGLVGGMAASVLATVVVAVLFGVGPFSFGQALVFGILVAIAAPFGDLAESLFKRDLGLKDMGTLLPGHGGLLDRFDGLLFVLPTAYYVMRLLDLVPLG